MKIVSVIGARPQFVKLSPLAVAVQRRPAVRHSVIHTGQHYDYAMSKVFFDELALPVPDHHLEVGSASHAVQTGKIMERLEPILQKEAPDWVLLYGDTNSTLAGALTAAKLHLPIAHVEAGLRSFNKSMPEEVNRVLTDHAASLLFCPTTTAVNNLMREGFKNVLSAGVLVEEPGQLHSSPHAPTADGPLVINVGDIMHDALRFSLVIAEGRSSILQSLGLQPKTYCLATIHRAENTDAPVVLRNIVSALARIDGPVIWPVHPRTASRLTAFGIVPARNIRLIEPVGYFDMLMLERSARLILTDSGGIQKEAFLLNTPCVTLRQETEWIETVACGANILAGSDPQTIGAAAAAVRPGHAALSPYGNGKTAESIMECLLAYSDNHPI